MTRADCTHVTNARYGAQGAREPARSQPDAAGSHRSPGIAGAVTSALKRAFDEASRLHEREQEFIAALVMEGIESERRCDEVFASSQDVLEKLDDEAVAEFEAGRTVPLDLNRL